MTPDEASRQIDKAMDVIGELSGQLEKAARMLTGIRAMLDDMPRQTQATPTRAAERYSNRTKLHDGDPMPIGKHKGKTLGEVPDQYWSWFLEQTWANQYPDLVAYAKAGESDE